MYFLKLQFIDHIYFNEKYLELGIWIITTQKVTLENLLCIICDRVLVVELYCWSWNGTYYAILAFQSCGNSWFLVKSNLQKALDISCSHAARYMSDPDLARGYKISGWITVTDRIVRAFLF